MTTGPRLVQEVRALLATRQPDAAIRLVDVAQRAGPLPAILVRLKAMGLLQAERTPAARAWLERAVVDHAGEPGLHALLAEARRRMGDLEGAVAALEVEAAREPRHWATVATLAESILDRPRARAAWQAAAAHTPQDAGVLARLAVAEEQSNDLMSAMEAAAAALAIAPEQPVALLVAARCARRTKDASGARAFLERIPDAQSGPSVWEERGRVAELASDATAARTAFETMNTTMRAQSPRWHFDRVRGGLIPSLEQLQRCWSDASPAWVRQPSAGAARPPVFLAGFNRSGTTLVGRMLGAHPELCLLDEEDAIDRVSQSIGTRWPGLLEELSVAELLQLRTLYRDRVAALLPDRPASSRALDKLPMHTMRLAMLHRLYPSAPVVFVHRDPRDVVLSNWMQCYAHNAITAHFDELAGCVALYTATMAAGFAQLRALPRLRVIRLRYEDLVADWRGEIQRVLAALDLDWHDRVENYRKADGIQDVKTPSYHQVAAPVYARAAGRWKRHADLLEPHLEALTPWVDPWS